MDAPNVPYTVTSVKHERGFSGSGQVAGKYTVTIEHNGGVKSSFVVPEGGNMASVAHAAAMKQVSDTANMLALPASAESQP